MIIFHGQTPNKYLECCRSGSTNSSSMKFHCPPMTEALSKTVTSATSLIEADANIPLGPNPITATFGLALYWVK